MPPRIESLLSARLHLSPQIVGDRIYFISDLSGRLSLYAMHYGGSVPEPLLPAHLSMPDPGPRAARLFFVFPLLDRILVMLDPAGAGDLQPTLIPIGGGFPEPAFGEAFKDLHPQLDDCDIDRNLAFFTTGQTDGPLQSVWRGDLRTRKLEKLAESNWGVSPCVYSGDPSKVLLKEGYSSGDNVLYLLEKDRKTLLFGTPFQARKAGEDVSLRGLNSVAFTPEGTGALVSSAVFDDHFSLGVIHFSTPDDIHPVRLEGQVHRGPGELTGLSHLKGAHYAVHYNIDGCSWLYEGLYNEEKRSMSLRHVLAGDGDLNGGVLQHFHYDRTADRFVLSYSSATSPTQLYTVEARDRMTIVMHTEERLLDLSESRLSPGEDASFDSFDGLRIPARLYLPAESLGYPLPRPLVYYIHGGPQNQARPGFPSFEIPLIQFLTLCGFAVFVPNVRGSSGYGMKYAARVDNDWGGQDRLDHVHAMTRVLSKDNRLDLQRAAVVGYSYGGTMALTLTGRHPDLWKAACDLSGPFDLLSLFAHVAEAWKADFRRTVGDPDTPAGRQFLQERSPRTYLDSLACPLLVIQGRLDPRLPADETESLVAGLQKQGRQVELLVFDDEGHAILKPANRMTCYNAIADFFMAHLGS